MLMYIMSRINISEIQYSTSKLLLLFFYYYFANYYCKISRKLTNDYMYKKKLFKIFSSITYLKIYKNIIDKLIRI